MWQRRFFGLIHIEISTLISFRSFASKVAQNKTIMRLGILPRPRSGAYRRSTAANRAPLLSSNLQSERQIYEEDCEKDADPCPNREIAYRYQQRLVTATTTTGTDKSKKQNITVVHHDSYGNTEILLLEPSRDPFQLSYFSGNTEVSSSKVPWTMVAYSNFGYSPPIYSLLIPPLLISPHTHI